MNRSKSSRKADASSGDGIGKSGHNQSIVSMFQRQWKKTEQKTEASNDTKMMNQSKQPSQKSKLSLRNRRRLRSNSESDNSSIEDLLDETRTHVTHQTEAPSAVKRFKPEDKNHLQVDGTKRLPYYLENFLLVLKTVVDDQLHVGLFNDDDMKTITTFHNISERAQSLYVRLFQRQFRWIRQEKIVYPELATDMSDTLQALVDSELIINEVHLTDLETTLTSLPSLEVKQLAASLKLNGCGTQHAQLTDAILKHSRQKNMTSFFMVGGGGQHGTAGVVDGTASMILRRAKSLLGSCYKLCEDRRAVFMRVLMLFGLQNSREDDHRQLPLYQMLMSNAGRVKYPTYSVLRSVRLFSDRDSLLRYSKALQLEHSEMRAAMEKKDYDQAMAIYLSITTDADRVLTDPNMLRFDASLPPFLRVFTTGSVYTRLLTQAVDLLEHRRLYREAVCLLEQLLEQTTYHCDYRGHWVDRLALDLEYHLGERAKALDVIQTALVDGSIRAGRRYSLLQRALKICSAPSASKVLKARNAEFTDDPMNRVGEPVKVTIHCMQPARCQPGTGPVYISMTSSHGGGDQDVTLLTRVEDAALEHYRSVGFPYGIHGEGATFRYLFCIFLWNILFADGIADVFYNAYQAAPLDLYADHFFESRRKMIEERLHCIMGSDSEELEAMLEKSLSENRGTFCLGLDWAMFSDEDIKGLVRCLGGCVLAGILERQARDMRHTRSGVPDLVVWNTQMGTYKIVEVKGPGDRLSSKQILWLDYLTRLGVDAEVCHVQPVGSKKLA